MPTGAEYGAASASRPDACNTAGLDIDKDWRENVVGLARSLCCLSTAKITPSALVVQGVLEDPHSGWLLVGVFSI